MRQLLASPMVPRATRGVPPHAKLAGCFRAVSVTPSVAIRRPRRGALPTNGPRRPRSSPGSAEAPWLGCERVRVMVSTCTLGRVLVRDLDRPRALCLEPFFPYVEEGKMVELALAIQAVSA